MKFYSFLPGIAWFVISSVLLAMPGNELPTTTLSKIPYFDKLVHLGMFALLNLFFCLPFRASSLPDGQVIYWFTLISTLVLSFGIAMEFVQRYLVANRSFDEADILFDGIGCTIGAFISWFFYKKDRPR